MIRHQNSTLRYCRPSENGSVIIVILCALYCNVFSVNEVIWQHCIQPSTNAVSHHVAGSPLVCLCSCVLEEAWLWRVIMQRGWDLMLSKLTCYCYPPYFSKSPTQLWSELNLRKHINGENNHPSFIVVAWVKLSVQIWVTCQNTSLLLSPYILFWCHVYTVSQLCWKESNLVVCEIAFHIWLWELSNDSKLNSYLICGNVLHF